MRLNLFYYLLTLFILIVSCKGYSQNQSDFNKIIQIFASSIDGENEFVYYRSMADISKFDRILELPLTKKHVFEIIKPLKGVDLNSLIDKEVVDGWNKKMSSYKSIRWNQEKLSDIPFIKKSEIPPYFFKGGPPKPGEEITTVYFVSTPIVYKDVAFVFYTIRSSPMMASSGYRVFAEINGQWQVVATDTDLLDKLKKLQPG